MNGSRYVAVDLGAESGRVMVGTLRDGRVVLEEAHRFANVPVSTPDGLHWDALRLYSDVLIGLHAVAQKHGRAVAGIGVDSWAVDYALLDAAGRLLSNPYHYRDARTDGLREQAALLVSPAEQYARTGIAQLPFNTLYQLMAQRRANDQSLDLAASLLMIPDLLHYWLSGVMATEYTNASTTGALGVDSAWTTEMLQRLDVPAHMLLAPVSPGTTLGTLRREVSAETGLGPVPIRAPATHDTACAVAAVPSEASDGAARHLYISCGTWSLLGLELERPILDEAARLAGFTNEGGVGGTYRFLTNIMGLWIMQECRRAWARTGREWSYDDLTAGAAAVPPPGVVIDVDDPAFLHPAEMPAALRAHLARTDQPALEQPIVMARAMLESLALAYRLALERAERLVATRVRVIHIVGGGARNGLLCQMTADACMRPVLAGPVEATALGNVLTQAMARREVGSLAEARAIARNSAQPRRYEPRADAYWDELYGRLRAVKDATNRQ